MSLQIHYQQKAADVVTVFLSGSLDSNTHALFETELQTILTEYPTLKLLVLDFDSLDYISSAGIRVTLSAKKKLKALGGQLGLLNLQPQIQKVFDIIKALPSFQIFDSTAELDRYLTAIQKKVLEEKREL
ncbi:MAG: STAS domain-containing protein [Proteobacteria bacterium]|nr:STAS domain-containing protein [Pseudomonadota bacterium]MBU1138649.1 STAS domain-containing protein [Pseudomonadota bacterium]MBU1417704.1 STAS domain-containing protein [Pseudomonadota bacterium]MBU1454956.1 STAS domain-containing protein [Pseudomonadota bacterium]